MECSPIERGNVILLEPNCVNINNDVVNGIPQYQDMYIFAELTAKSKGRTVIIDNNYSAQNSASPQHINFIGNDQNNEDPNNPNYLNFTTNYYEGSTGNQTHYEGFGMSSIKITTNSSFIPEVAIQFVDVRGLAFFNQVESPYRILFDFPPPIFTLTVKGYYGKPVSYQLHLVKYTSEFNAANGNFVIDAQFVAMTFAPLADILFRYVVNAPLINNLDSMNPEPGVPPTNTYELVLKLKSLYAAIAKFVETDVDNQSYRNAITEIDKIDLTLELLKNNAYKENEALKSAGKPQLISRRPNPNESRLIFPITNSVPNDELTVITALSEYDTLIKTEQSSGEGSRIKDRLYIVYVAATNVEQEDNTEDPNLFQVQTFPFEYDTENDSQFDEPLLNFKNQLLSEEITSIIVEDGKDIVDPASFLNIKNIQSATSNTTGYTKYYGMDISGFYQKLYYRKSELELEKTTLSEDITRKINAMVEERLGMIPSIYNVFKIILDDVDQFFFQVKSASNEAYKLHNEPLSVKKIILGDSDYAEEKGNETEVFPFPLVVETVENRKERVAPIALSKKVPFPEIDLVNNFIDTFLDQNNFGKQLSARENQDDDGTYKWIPISPLDSVLGDASPSSPYVGISDSVRIQVLETLVKRFYMLTQGTIPEAFYPNTDGKRKDNSRSALRSQAYLNLYSKAEAINIETSILTKDNSDTLQIMADGYARNIESFYTDLEKIKSSYYTDSGEVDNVSLYDFPQYDPTYFLVSPSSPTTGRVYVDKTNPNFNGIKITNEVITLQNLAESSGKPVDNFKGETKIAGLFDNDKGKKSIAEFYFDFTEQNLLYLRDRKNTQSEDSFVDYGGEINTYTRYLARNGDQYVYYFPGYVASNGTTYLETKDYYNSFPGWEDRKTLSDAQRQEIAYEEGNAAFKDYVDPERKQLNFGADIIAVWSEQLSRYDDDIISDITGTTNLSSILVLSNFGYTISPFNKYPGLLNELVFDTPSAIEVPVFYSAYVGALLRAVEDENPWIDEVKDFFTTGNGSNFNNRGFYVLADARDAVNHLSENDKERFKTSYDTYMIRFHADAIKGIGDLYNAVLRNIEDNSLDTRVDYILKKMGVYEFLLNPISIHKPAATLGERIISYGNKGMYFNILSSLIDRETIVNYSQITFMKSDEVPPYPAGYTSLKTLNDSGDKYITEYNNNFFIKTFNQLSSLIVESNKKFKEEAEEQKKIKGDKNIINQLYYSFKNINDKWLTGTAKDKLDYPFNKKGRGLIDSFAFVDRGMNPIGETILNCEILGDMLDDPNISLYTVISQLLSLNGFVFFPIQNFLNFENEKSWEESFKIHTAGYDDDPNPFFVCMYIGGSSSYPSVSGNGFKNDGIIDIAAPGIPGFSGDDTGSQYEENQNQENTDFKFREVRAFRVRFGEQNQSMFTDIKIDSKEYPETNESIQILSRLAGDQNPNAPVPIGQSLYNLYENRSYKATVTGFGNAMIQPTQYFQLENIPLFNGAYIILDVQHNITANKMTTTFSGTKLLEYPMPRVLTPIAVAGYDGLSGGDAATRALQVQQQQNNAEVANTALQMSKERVENLNSELGVDVSHYNGVVNWSAMKDNGVKFAFIKLTQGRTLYDGDTKRYPRYNLNKNILGAVDNDINVSYYHFASFGRTSSPTQDGIDDANHFIQRINQVPASAKPKLPVVLDLEEECFLNDYKWGQISKPNPSINTFVKSFIDTMEDGGYDVMIYCRNDLVLKWELENYSKYPYWVARYYKMGGRYNPEQDEPTAPKAWKNNWQAWQFTPTGNINGVRGNVDLNVMRKDFFEKYT